MISTCARFPTIANSRQLWATRRIQFDLECHFFRMQSEVEVYLAEVVFVFENKGFVEHRLYDLSLSVHGLSPTLLSDSTARTGRAFNVKAVPAAGDRAGPVQMLFRSSRRSSGNHTPIHPD